MSFYENIEKTFPRFQHRTWGLVTDWESVRGKVPNVILKLTSGTATYGELFDAIELDYRNWCDSNAPQSRLSPKVAAKIVRPTRYAHHNYAWYVPLVASLLSSTPNQDTDPSNSVHVNGAYTRQSLPWALVFTTIPLALSQSFSNLFLMEKEEINDAELNENLVVFASQVNKMRKLKFPTLSAFKNQVACFDSVLTSCFYGTPLEALLDGRRRNSALTTAAKALSVEMYQWLDGVKNSAELKFLDTETSSSLERSFYEQAADWVIANRVKTAKLPREVAWSEYVNTMVRVSNIVASYTDSGKASGGYLSQLHHIILLNSKPTAEYQKWLTSVSPIYRMLSFS